ncbi:DUF6124 family protein [Pseudomonas sp. A-B-19]|uniref:DUF6124 family protein n=1 Tax=Pseudomonas sp. A-B-19 TaxID=2832405 RepID=UPI001CBFA089|nr:DUF6124 family protein [Pseudomonas sp. A-B-19]
MFKPTPNPPETDNVSIDPQKLHEAADRALDDYINLSSRINATAKKTNTMFAIAPGIGTESLLAHACESLASASVLASDFARVLHGSQRHTMLAIQQIIMLGELAVNQALDNLDPQV